MKSATLPMANAAAKTAWRMPSILLAIAFVLFGCVSGKETQISGPTAAQLVESWGGGKYKDGGWELNQHWVGTLKVVIKSKLYEEGDKCFNEDVAFRENALLDSVPPTLIQFSANNRCSCSAVYRKDLPAIADLKDPKKARAILTSFGPSHCPTTGLVGDDTRHWTEGWDWFEPLAPNRIRVLSVGAHMVSIKYQPAEIEEWIVREGFLRQSNPNDPKDNAEFPPEDKLEAGRQALTEAEDNANPEPLRSFLKACHTPGDFDLNAYAAAIHAFREKPDATLLKQLVERRDEGPGEVDSITKALFKNDSLEKKIGAWKPENRRKAVGMLVDAIPFAKGRSLMSQATTLAILETGIGKIYLDSPELKIDITARRDDGSESYSCGSFDIHCSDQRAGEIIRDEIYRLWKPDAPTVHRTR